MMRCFSIMGWWGKKVPQLPSREPRSRAIPPHIVHHDSFPPSRAYHVCTAALCVSHAQDGAMLGIVTGHRQRGRACESSNALCHKTHVSLSHFPLPTTQHSHRLPSRHVLHALTPGGRRHTPPTRPLPFTSQHKPPLPYARALLPLTSAFAWTYRWCSPRP